ncbi:BTAD domain-containing putative transcriptional regulator [Streptomyces sp. t39]|uniref:AfsR/SARP family transcriptional regulator n=1 Tax=Streptomyces sp. t39 TaxID=1828156 RepID=UPI0011CD4E33|nr:BTAD domain-containing putative transcriptional regulator [Streptomyces sp. t39]TXS35493.1 AfsR/SARP family transcriptional regulator [Streptomyces sp. t39]
MEFRVLGPLEVVADGRRIEVTAPRLQQVLSLLVLRRNTFVNVSELVDELWPDNPPVSAVSTVQTYVYKIRKLLDRYGAGHMLEGRPGGYQLGVPDAAVDLPAFEDALGEGRAVLEQDDAAAASSILARGLALWRGAALAGVVAGELLSAYVTRIEEARFLALELRIEADLRLGRHLELLSELKSLVVAHPLHERFHACLMLTLHHAGRRGEALGVYAALRRSMSDELGLEPGEDVQRLHQELLSTAVSLGPVVGYRPAEPAVRPPVPGPARENGGLSGRPAQLPHDTPDFTGRSAERRRIAELLTAPVDSDHTATRMAVLTGLPGAGTSALAVHAAHRVRAAFPDGQLYAELDGSGAPQEPGDVLAGLLRSLGVPSDLIPDGVEERGNLFRSATAGRRILLVLDDAASAEQVRPLLPGDPSCAVLITSGRRLHGLTGVPHLTVEPLRPSEGLAFLERTLGTERVAGEPAAAARLVELTGGLPLALRCVAGRLATQPAVPLRAAAVRLAGAADLIAEFRFGALDVRSRYDAGYRGLGHVEQGVIRLLGRLPRSGFSAGAAAEVLGVEARTVERALETLFDHHLLRLHSCGPAGESRYAFADVVRRYAHARPVFPRPRRSGGDRPPLSALPTGDLVPAREGEPVAHGASAYFGRRSAPDAV